MSVKSFSIKYTVLSRNRRLLVVIYRQIIKSDFSPIHAYRSVLISDCHERTIWSEFLSAFEAGELLAVRIKKIILSTVFEVSIYFLIVKNDFKLA